MDLTLEAIPVPLWDDGHGAFCVGQTRVSFESVWQAYQEGAGPDEIAAAFVPLHAADVCAVLAWALRHPGDVQAYLKQRADEADQIRRELEAARLTPTVNQTAVLKEKLVARSQERHPRRAPDAGLSDG